MNQSAVHIKFDLMQPYTGDDVVVGKSKIGRACGLAANALKARTLLYAASHTSS